MKKLIALIMVLAVALFATGALAENAVNWSDIEAQVEGIEGDFYTFDEISVQIWVPAVLENIELGQEDVDAGYIGYFQAADGSAAVGVQYVNVDGMSLEDYAAALPEYGASEIEMGTVNGLPCVSYTLPESDAGAAAFATEAGYIFEVSAAPISDEGFASLAAIIMASIQPM